MSGSKIHNTFVLDTSHLPPSFKTIIIPSTEECYTLRADLKTESDIVIWIREFEELSKTQRNFRRSNGTRIISYVFTY